MMYIICIIITALTTGLPTFLAVAFGDVLVTTIIDAMPVWFTPVDHLPVKYYRL
ncbi:MAG: hypothetical protein ACLRL6_09880 [Clostridium sp.]